MNKLSCRGVVSNTKLFSCAEVISLFRLRTSVRPLILSLVESTFRVIRKDKLESMWKKVVVACFKVFRWNLPWLTVEYHQKPRSEQLVCSPLDYWQWQPNIQPRFQRGIRNRKQTKFAADISTIHMPILIILSSMKQSFVQMRSALPTQHTTTTYINAHTAKNGDNYQLRFSINVLRWLENGKT